MIRTLYLRLPIATKLRLLITAACIGSILLVGVSIIAAEWLIMRDRLVHALAGQAVLLADTTAPALTFRNVEDAQESLAALRSTPGIVAATIFDRDGNVFATFTTPASDAAIAAQPPHESHLYADGTLTVWVPVKGRDDTRIGTLALCRTQQAIYERIALFAGVMGVIAGVAAWIAFLLSGWLQRRFTEPLVALTSAVDRVTRQRDLSVRVKRISEDEIGVLADAFNLMLSDVEASQAEADALYRRVRNQATELEARVQERTAELTRANRELEAFSYSVSHDLRAPLRAISTYAEVLLEESGNRLTPESVQYARRILVAISRMNVLIDGLLDMARLSNRPLTFAAVDVAAMAREIGAEILGTPVPERVVFRVEEMAPIPGDPVLLRQVLFNLVSNAVKYSRDRERAEITVGEAAPTAAGQRVFFVQDNGAGFDPAHAHRLFQMFERLHDPRAFEGTGIGLATSRRIVERHGGRIWAESVAGREALFFFSLPAAPSEGREVPVTATRATSE